MIQSLFILSPTGEILIERHFRGMTPRTVCDHFWERACVSLNHHGGVSTASTAAGFNPLALYDSLPPIMEIPMDGEHGSGGNGNGSTIYLFSILRDGLSYLAACPGEISPLLVIEFMHRVADIFVDYFGSPADESAIKDNFSTVYQLLEEMVDHGWPLITEPNALQAIIRPPDVMGKLLSVVTGVSDSSVKSPSGTLPNIPWRRAGVKHNPNEIYLDIVEEIDAVVDIVGNVISFDVAGSIQVQSKLSGIPDLLLTFKDPSLIDDCSLHPCVRYNRFEEDGIVSFVPPDGHFTLMRYRVKPSALQMGFTPPIICTPLLRYGNANANAANGGNNTNNNDALNGSIDVKIAARSISTLFNVESKRGSVAIENVSVSIPFPKIVKTANLKVNVGQVLYDETSKVAKWTIGDLDEKMRPHLTGVMKLDGTKRPDENPTLSITWNIPLVSLSGLTVGGLSVTGERYKPYKGVRNIVKSGRFQVRCS